MYIVLLVGNAEVLGLEVDELELELGDLVAGYEWTKEGKTYRRSQTRR